MPSDLKLGTKISLAFVAVLALTAVLGGIAYVSTADLRDRLEALAAEDLVSVRSIGVFAEAHASVMRRLNGTALGRDMTPAQRANSSAKAVEAMHRADAGASAFKAVGHGQAVDEAYQALARADQAFRSRAEQTFALAGQRDQQVAAGAAAARVAELDAQIRGLWEKAASDVKVADDALAALQQAQAEETLRHVAEGRASARRSILLVVLTVLATAALVLVLGVLLGRSVHGTVRALTDETGRLADAVTHGQLGVRGDAAEVGVEFRPIVDGMNRTMDAFTGPLHLTADYVDRISRGDIPPKITDHYEGDFNAIKDNLNRCIDAVQALVADAGRLARAGVEGRLATRADASKHQGDFRKVVQGVNDTLDAVIGPLTVAAHYVDSISKGQIPEKITAAYAGDFNTIKENLNRCIDAVDRLVADAGMLAQAGVEGRLATRADASRHEGDFRKVVEGVNATLDAVIGPLNVAARYVDEISRGQIPPKISDRYAGDFNAIKDSLNTCIEAVNLLVADAGRLVDAAVAGRLQTRADASRHHGDFRKVVEGVNQTLDAVVAPIAEAAGVLERLSRRDLRARVMGSYQGDHARIKDSLNATGEALHDALSQVAAAVDQVTSAATQIAASSQAVASGASEQAAALQQTTSSLDSVGAMTATAADHAVEANALSQAARAAATEGAAAVEQMQGAMTKIRASAEGTSQIIRDINDIAFQTNLLALNAAVEAARAGEAGRGFAVVAEEVRSLALRSKEAATKTEALIRESVKQAGEGEVTSRRVAGQLAEIVTGVAKVSEIISEMATASKAQATGIQEVSGAVEEMDKVTQQNAASAEESSSAASELSGQAEELSAMVGAFQLARR